MSKPDIPAIATQLYQLLEPLDSDVRRRAIKAALVMLGSEENTRPEKSKENEEEGDGDSTLPPKVRSWMRTHGVTVEHINHVFHLEGGAAEVIAAETVGKNGREKTINAYVLTGISAFLQSGEPKFNDKTARATCKSLGHFDAGNHAYYLKGKKNVLSGTKDSGWTLTGPGLRSGAELIKALAAK